MTEAKEFAISWGYLWWDSLPVAWGYKAETIKQTVLPVDVAREIRSRCVALRLSFPDRTGILGLEFAKFKSETLSVEIYVNNSQDENVVLQAGLLDEYGKAVLEEITNTISELSGFSGGIIRVNHAAWHEVDSPPFMFRLLSRSLIELLLKDSISRDIADDTIREIRRSLWEKQ